MLKKKNVFFHLQLETKKIVNIISTDKKLTTKIDFELEI